MKRNLKFIARASAASLLAFSSPAQETPSSESGGKEIGREIRAETGMTVIARNVKVATNEGQVTLRGPVTTAVEKRLLGEMAGRIARSANVDNQLEVKLNTSSSQ